MLGVLITTQTHVIPCYVSNFPTKCWYRYLFQPVLAFKNKALREGFRKTPYNKAYVLCGWLHCPPEQKYMEQFST